MITNRRLNLVVRKTGLRLPKTLWHSPIPMGVFSLWCRRSIKKNYRITDEEAKKIADTNNIQQKINRFIEPSITTIRTKMFNVDEQTVAIIYVPQSKDLTHIISKDGEFSHQSGNKKVMLRKGTFYVRHSATNHLGDSVDFEKMIERRIDQFREALMDKVAKVVHSPIASDVYILNEDTTELDIETKQVKITDSPDAIPVKGIGFTTEPKGVDQKSRSLDSIILRVNSMLSCLENKFGHGIFKGKEMNLKMLIN